MWRLFATWAVGLITVAGFAQPTMMRPDISVVVSEHQTTADMVEVTALRDDYPIELMREQCERLGAILGAPVRGLQVTKTPLSSDDPKLAFVKAKFATNNIIRREDRTLHVQPILRAFAAAPDPFTVKQIQVVFAGERPNEQTVRTLSKPGVLNAVARASNAPAGIEYSIELLTQDPDKIVFPERLEKPEPLQEEQPEKGSNQTVLIALLAIAAVSLGALVYSLFLRSGQKRA